MLSSSRNFLRHKGAPADGKVAFAELFFDLVFVFAVTQISHTMLEHFTVAGVLQAAFLLMAIWWVWIFTSWVTNWLDPQRNIVRLMLYVLMLAGLFLSMSLPEAFGEKGLVFALSYAFIQVGRSFFMCWALYRHSRANFRNFVRISCWLVVSGTFWLLGGFAEGSERILFWCIALFIEYISPACAFWVPVLGRSTTTEWDISGEHISERCGLFIIIVLGESILILGSTFSAMPWDQASTTAFISAFIATVAMWWLYFNVGAEEAAHYIAHAADPGRIARLAFTYLPILLVAGLVMSAVAAELVLAHPLGHTEFSTALAICSGPALYLMGNMLFKRVTLSCAAWSHLIGSVLLAGSLTLYHDLSPLALGLCATTILAGTAAWETWYQRRKRLLKIDTTSGLPDNAQPRKYTHL